MGEYKLLIVLVLVIFAIVIFNKVIPWWGKALVVIYYSVISYLFVTRNNQIEREYEGILPVPEDYWDENSGWVSTMMNYYFWPLVFIVLFLYINLFRHAPTKTAKGLIMASLIPVTMLFLIGSFLFGFG